MLYLVLLFFLSFRHRLIENYDELFGEQGGETTSSRAGFSKKWGWYSSLYGLAAGDITRFENITKLGMHQCLMMLAFMKDKNELESKQIKSKFK